MLTFSVVISVYKGDDPDHFEVAVNSLLSQKVIPSEIVISVDGSVPKPMERLLTMFAKMPTVKVLRCKKNAGLASSRNYAIENCTHPLIAVMDSDDICCDDRFKRQLEIFENNDVNVVGGFIEEFNVTPGDKREIRAVPTTWEEISRFVKWRNPVNHVTLMFERAEFDRVGGYRTLRYSEDWDLIVRMIHLGVKIQNIKTTLVHVRGGANMYRKRRQKGQVFQDIAIIKNMNELGMTNRFEMFLACISRLFILVFPAIMMGPFYRVLLRKKI